MFKLVVLSCLLVAASAAFIPTPRFEGRVVNGEPIDITRVPYQVAVGGTNSIWCGGSIVSKRYIITAAHCFNEHAPVGIVAFVGMTRLDAISATMMKRVSTVTIHPDYDRVTNYYDFAILELENDLVFNDKIQPVGLPSYQATVPYGRRAYASGWGKLQENGQSSIQLQGVSLELFSGDKCGRYQHFNDAVNVCAGSLDGSVDTCQGDSGGPLVYNNILYGVTSYGRGCATPGFPGVYAHVANLRDYITQVTGL